MKKWFFVFTLLIFQSTALYAENYEVKMLDFGADGSMVFEPGFLSVQPGDSITFVPSSTGHFVRSAFLPKGEKPWLSKMDEKYTVTVEKNGVYVYYCPPHLSMAMIGVIQAGEVSGKLSFTEEMQSFNRRTIMSKGRLWQYIDQIKWSED